MFEYDDDDDDEVDLVGDGDDDDDEVDLVNLTFVEPDRHEFARRNVPTFLRATSSLHWAAWLDSLYGKRVMMVNVRMMICLGNTGVAMPFLHERLVGSVLGTQLLAGDDEDEEGEGEEDNSNSFISIIMRIRLRRMKQSREKFVLCVILSNCY